MSSESPVILITGSSTGLGRFLALEALARGMRVIATARRLSSIEDLAQKGAKIIMLDVTAPPETLKQKAQDAIAAFGQIDILINNAGWLLGAAIEESTASQIQSQFDTNFFGVVNLTNALLPHFRYRKSGTIINISSQGAYLAVEGAGIYCASKAALDSITETWSKELAPWNIRFTAINLGDFRTPVISNSQRAEREIEGYDGPHAILQKYYSISGQQLGDTSKGAKKILDIAVLDKPLPTFVAVGEDAISLVQSRLEGRLAKLLEWREYGIGTNVDGLTFQL